MKIAEALILRKQLAQKIEEIEPLKEQAKNGYFKDKVTRIRIHEPIPGATHPEGAGGTDEVTQSICEITPESIFKAWDELCTCLRKIDAALQQANWEYSIIDVQVPEALK